jgi:5'-nucleotidase
MSFIHPAARRLALALLVALGANVVDAKTGQPFGGTPLFDVREFGGVKVGLFGIVRPETKTTSKPGPDTEFRDFD